MHKDMAKINLKQIAEMSDDEIYKLSAPHPNHPERRGFMYQLKDFDSKEDMAECMYLLIKRLSKIKK